MKLIYMQGKHWIVLEDAPDYCELDWEILIKKLRNEISPDEPMIKLKKMQSVKTKPEMELGFFKSISKKISFLKGEE